MSATSAQPQAWVIESGSGVTVPVRRHILFLLTALAATLVAGCQKAVDQSDPLQLKAAAEVVLLPHVVPERREEILQAVGRSSLPASIKAPALSGIPDEESRAARIVLSQLGASQPDVSRRIRELSRLVNGVTERPMGASELQKIEPWIEARMHWAAVDGSLLLGRDGGEVGQLTAGLNLAKSQGLTRHGAEMVRNMVNPVLDQWKTAPVAGFAADVRYIAALFGARESVEAAVVIFSVLTAIGLAGSGRVAGGKIFTGVGAAVVLAVLTGFLWSLVIQAGTLAGGKQTTFLAFGIISIAMFLLIGSAIFHPVYFGKWMSRLRGVGRGNPGQAVFLVSFLAVYREGFEMSLSMTTLSMMGGWGAVWQGLGVGIPAGLLMIAVGWKVHRGWIGVRGMLVASGAMMVVAAASFSALFVNYLEQQGTISPVYLLKDVPVAVTVFTGLSGSAQTLLAFVAVGGALIGPWCARRLANLPRRRSQATGREGRAGELEGVLKVFAAAGLLATAGAASQWKTGGSVAEPVGEVSWEYASDATKKGTALLVDTRTVGSLPAADGAVGFPMDNDDASIKEFCEFAGEGKEILVLGNGTDGETMARRIGSLCGKEVKKVLWDGPTP
jgi:hypothetical protein